MIFSIKSRFYCPRITRQFSNADGIPGELKQQRNNSSNRSGQIQHMQLCPYVVRGSLLNSLHEDTIQKSPRETTQRFVLLYILASILLLDLGIQPGSACLHNLSMSNLVLMYVSMAVFSLVLERSLRLEITFPIPAVAPFRFTYSTNTTEGMAVVVPSITVERTIFTVLALLANAIQVATSWWGSCCRRINWSCGQRSDWSCGQRSNWSWRGLWHQLNRNIRPSWGNGCIDRVNIDSHGGSTSTNIIDGIDLI